MNTLTIKEASELIGIPQQKLRILIQQGKTPFAECFKNRTVYCYVVYKDRLIKYLKGEM